jgi:hypothetical protein
MYQSIIYVFSTYIGRRVLDDFVGSYWKPSMRVVMLIIMTSYVGGVTMNNDNPVRVY